MLNISVIQGRLTADPELKHTNSDVSVCSFSVAVDRDFVKQSEDRQADFPNVVAWRQTAEFVAKYFKKGQMILVTGRLQTRKWTDNDGKTRYATEIVADHVNFCGSKSDNSGGGQNAPTAQSAPAPAAASAPPANGSFPATNSDFVEIDGDDDLPF